MSHAYVMDSPQEGQRLRSTEAAHPSRERLLATGLRPGMRAADVGCGAGAVIAQILEIVGPAGDVVGIDPSTSRLAEARAALATVPNLQLLETALPRTGLPDAAFDYVWCQYVLEYIPEPANAVAELKRIASSGGRVVVSEIDEHGLHNWPFPAIARSGADAMERALRKTGFDLYCGRKMFQLFRQAGFQEIRVHLSPLYVAAGTADEQLLDDWRIRFKALTPVAIGEFGSLHAYEQFTRTYLEMLADPDALKYAIILTTEGTRP
jgi:ubiquinone/menaquinone biosynthesis C-methylase UbiE